MEKKKINCNKLLRNLHIYQFELTLD